MTVWPSAECSSARICQDYNKQSYWRMPAWAERLPAKMRREAGRGERNAGAGWRSAR